MQNTLLQIDISTDDATNASKEGALFFTILAFLFISSIAL